MSIEARKEIKDEVVNPKIISEKLRDDVVNSINQIEYYKKIFKERISKLEGLKASLITNKSNNTPDASVYDVLISQSNSDLHKLENMHSKLSTKLAELDKIRGEGTKTINAEAGGKLDNYKEELKDKIEVNKIDSGYITESLGTKYPKYKKLLESMIIKNVKISGAEYSEIYKQLDLALFNLGLNTGTRIVSGRPGEFNRTEVIDFGEPNSKNILVKDFKEKVRGVFPDKDKSPFHPAMYN